MLLKVRAIRTLVETISRQSGITLIGAREWSGNIASRTITYPFQSLKAWYSNPEDKLLDLGPEPRKAIEGIRRIESILMRLATLLSEPTPHHLDRQAVRASIALKKAYTPSDILSMFWHAEHGRIEAMLRARHPNYVRLGGYPAFGEHYRTYEHLDLPMRIYGALANPLAPINDPALVALLAPIGRATTRTEAWKHFRAILPALVPFTTSHVAEITTTAPSETSPPQPEPTPQDESTPQSDDSATTDEPNAGAESPDPQSDENENNLPSPEDQERGESRKTEESKTGEEANAEGAEHEAHDEHSGKTAQPTEENPAPAYHSRQASDDEEQTDDAPDTDEENDDGVVDDADDYSDDDVPYDMAGENVDPIVGHTRKAHDAFYACEDAVDVPYYLSLLGPTIDGFLAALRSLQGRNLYERTTQRGRTSGYFDASRLSQHLAHKSLNVFRRPSYRAKGASVSVCFLVDDSGSMSAMSPDVFPGPVAHAFPQMSQIQSARLIGLALAEAVFQVNGQCSITTNNHQRVEPWERKNHARALSRIVAAGGSEPDEALRSALANIDELPTPRIIVFITDGAVYTTDDIAQRSGEILLPIVPANFSGETLYGSQVVRLDKAFFKQFTDQLRKAANHLAARAA